MKQKILQAMIVVLACVRVQAQVNSGSDGSDGAFNPATNMVINMADHPNGIFQYTSVNISNGVTVTFIPNANNTPVTWLVQSNVVINGVVDVSGQNSNDTIGGAGGPGGGAGGSGGSNPSSGQGPGGGNANADGTYGVSGSFGTLGRNAYNGVLIGQIYGNAFLVPLLGGSGGGGNPSYPSRGGGGGGGGGGAILVAASNSIQLNGAIIANGGQSDNYRNYGSGGGIRLVTVNFSGAGSIDAYGVDGTGAGRVRIDAFQNTFGGGISADPSTISQGFQPVIVPVAGQGVQLRVASVGGVAVSALPTGQLVTPDAVLSSQQANPIPVVVNCVNLPLNTAITVTVKPAANGSSVSALGYNTAGTPASSTATLAIVMPRGGGIIYATATTGN